MELIVQICVIGIVFILGAIFWTMIDVLLEEHQFLSLFFRFLSSFLIAFFMINYLLPNVV